MPVTTRSFTSEKSRAATPAPRRPLPNVQDGRLGALHDGRMTTTQLQPRLVVRDAPKAIDFYVTALGAEEVERYAEPSGKIVHCELRLGGHSFSLTEEDLDHSPSPLAVGGSGVLLRLTVPDADAVGQAMESGGAEVIIPIEARYYGPREGRLRDPFGHLWIISQEVEDLSPDEVQARIDQGA